MKRILSIILLAAFLIQSSVAVIAGDTADAVVVSDAISFMQAFDIMSFEGEISKANVTRDEFALYIGKMLRLNEFIPADDRYYRDLDMDGYTTGVINTLTQMGILSQSSDKRFRPNDEITKHEAYKMLLCALGYGEYCEVSGGFPQGYVRAATNLGLSVDGNTLTVSEAAEIIYNALQVPVYTAKGYTDDGMTNYSANSGETILSIYWNIVFREAKVDSVYTGSCGDTALADEGSICVGGKWYDLAEGVDADGYLADYVKIFFDEDSEVIKYIELVNDEETIEINIEDFGGFDGRKVKYYDETGRERNVSVENANIIYNGMPLSTNVGSTLKNLTKGTIKIKDSNKNDMLDTILIEDYRTFIVSKVNTSEKVIYNELTLTDVDNIPFEEFDNIRIKTSNGDKVDFSYIEKDMVLSVAPSKNKEILTVIVAKDFYNGVMSQLVSTRNEKKICIDGKLYTVDKQYAAEKWNMIENMPLNETVTIKCDMFGDVVYVVSNGGFAGNLGYLVDIAEDGVFNKEISLKIFDADGNMKKLYIRDRVEIDGKNYKNLDESKLRAVEALGDVSGNVAQIIRYTTIEDEIKMIDTAKLQPTENEENSLIPAYGNTNQRMYNNLRVGMKGVVDASTLVFCIPNNAGAEDIDYRVCAPASVLVSNAMYCIDTYTFGEQMGIATAAVLKYSYDELNKNYSTTIRTFVVAEKMQKINEQGDIVEVLVGFEQGKKVEYEIDASRISLDGMNIGDLLLITYDINGVPTGTYSKLYEQSADLPDPLVWKGMTDINLQGDERTLFKKGDTVNSDYYTSGFQLSFGYVSRVNDGVIAWHGKRKTNEYTEAANTNNVPIVVIEKNDRGDVEVYAGTVEDVLDYNRSEGQCSRVIYHAYGFLGKAIHIYK